MLSKTFRRTEETEKANRKRFKKKNGRRGNQLYSKEKRFLIATIEDLIKDADKHALDVAKKKDFQLLEKSNNLQPSFFVRKGNI